MSASLLVYLAWAIRLTCWPFEVEGRGSLSPPPARSDLPPLPNLQAPPPPRQPVVGAPAGSPPDADAKSPSPAPLPPFLPLFHEARYDIRYGIFGSVGALYFSVGGVRQGSDGGRLVRIQGGGAGAVLGLGSIERRIEAEFDPQTLESRSWTILRLRNGQTEPQAVRDTAFRGAGGALVLEHASPGQPPARQTVLLPAPTLDPLGLLWRLRTAPPTPGHDEIAYILDGQALWRIRIATAAAREILPEGGRTTLRMDGDLAPILYDGQPDGGRPTRHFTLWLSDAADHLPLRLEVPVGPANVVMTLVDRRALPGQGLSGAPSSEAGAGPTVPGGARTDGTLPPRSGAPTAPAQLTVPVPGARSL